MTRSSQDIEREVEVARDDLDRTVEALKDKMSPGQLIDELSRSFKSGGAGDMINNLGAQARENPMALAMIGAGMAWLMMGRSAPHGETPNPSSTTAYGLGGTASSRSPLEGVGEAAGSMAGKVGDTIASAKDAGLDAAQGAAENLQQLGGRAAAAARSAGGSVSDMLEQEPLVIGAFGLAVGVALGAAFPSTTAENRAFGPARDKLLHAGEQKLAQAVDDVRSVGTAALDAAKSEAEGLSPR